MGERYFNREQEAYMSYIFSVPREKRCACGWFLLGECTREKCRQAVADHPGAGGTEAGDE